MENKYIKESDVKKVLKKDGISKVSIEGANAIHLNSDDYLKKTDESWAKRVVYNKQMSAHLIYQNPGETNRTHYHEIDDEWWVILKGEIKWWIQDHGIIYAKAGDIVYAPSGKQHKIKTIGANPSIRLAICRPDIEHKHPTTDNAPVEF